MRTLLATAMRKSPTSDAWALLAADDDEDGHDDDNDSIGSAIINIYIHIYIYIYIHTVYQLIHCPGSRGKHAQERSLSIK